MYYKIVGEGCFFTNLYKDVFHIPHGAIFTAPKLTPFVPGNPEFFWDRETNQCTPACEIDAAVVFIDRADNLDYTLGESVFHFAEGPLDTMLWNSVISASNTVIYSVEPLGTVTKKRCLDSWGLYQCGASKIKILEKQDRHKLYEMALLEYAENPDRYHNLQINTKTKPAEVKVLMPYKQIREIMRQRGQKKRV